MLGIPSQVAGAAGALLGQAGGPPRSPEAQFGEIFIVFTILGTLVGIVVIGYTLLNAYKYRDGTGNGEKADVVRPEPGQIPTGSGGGKKLFLSFGISAFIVLSLVIWTYSALLYVENTPEQQEPDLTVGVEGERFLWHFTYPNGYESTNTLVVPEDQMIQLQVETRDVFHTFGIPAFRAKADAMPGFTLDTWFVPDETGEFEAHCYELCGAGHSNMDANVTVVSQEEFEQWYAGTESEVDGNESQADGGNETAMEGNQTPAEGNETAAAENQTAADGNVTAAAGNQTGAPTANETGAGNASAALGGTT